LDVVATAGSRRRRAHTGGGFDGGHHPLGLLGPAVREQPARALRHVPAHQQDRHRQHGAHQEADPPAVLRPEHARIQQHQAQHRAQAGPNPEAAVDREVHPSAHAGRDQLVDGGVDGRVLAADADAGDEAAQREAGEAGAERGGHRGRHVDQQREQEQALAPEPVGHASERQRAQHGACHVHRARPAHLPGGERQRVVALEDAADRSDQRHLQAIQHPGHAQREHHAPVPARPGQAVQALGDRRHGGHAASMAEIPRPGGR
jgi:hypothetical protein